MENTNYCFTFLNTSDPDEVALYERALYRAFSPSKTEQEKIDELTFIYNHLTKRVCSRLGYSQQKIFTYRPKDRIICAVTINYDMKSKLQLEMEGFHIEKNKSVCEALSLFNVGDTGKLKLFMEDVLRYLKAEKIQKIYGTCNNKNLKPYLSLGFCHESSNEISNLISFTL